MMVFGLPINLSMIAVMAPVAYMPPATRYSTATVSIPSLLKPLRSSSAGASLRVMAAVSAPRNKAAGGILVLTRSTKVAPMSARVR